MISRKSIKTKKKKDPKPKKIVFGQKLSTTGSESGLFVKGEHKKVFAYNIQTACDINGWILYPICSPGNVHDSRAFPELFEHLKPCKPNKIIMDSGYKVPYLAKFFFDQNILPILPYTRPRTKEGFFKKIEFAYDEQNDCYICPNDKILDYSTTDRDGYKHYKSDPQICSNCPHLEKCTLSKNKQKIITRHIWSEYLEEAEELKSISEIKELYNKKKKLSNAVLELLKNLIASVI